MIRKTIRRFFVPGLIALFLRVVSQKFHNERAIYLAQKHGCKNVIGFTASRVSTFGGFRTRMREYLARVKTVLDVTILKTEPKFLGEKVELGGPVT